MDKQMTVLEMAEVKNLDLEEELAKEKSLNLKKDMQILTLNIEKLNLQKVILGNRQSAASNKQEDVKNRRRQFLKDIAEKYNIESDVWGYDPLTGDIIENKTQE